MVKWNAFVVHVAGELDIPWKWSHLFVVIFNFSCRVIKFCFKKEMMLFILRIRFLYFFTWAWQELSSIRNSWFLLPYSFVILFSLKKILDINEYSNLIIIILFLKNWTPQFGCTNIWWEELLRLKYGKIW